MNRLKYPKIINISAVGFPDAWYQLLQECLKKGVLKRRFYGQPVDTYDIISLTSIEKPLLEPMLHPQFPTKELHCMEYEKQWNRDYNWRKQGFEYNYMNRLVSYPVTPDLGNLSDNEHYHKSHIEDSYFIDQLKIIREKIAKRIEKGGECLVSNRDEAITWIPDRDLFVDEDQPCLQRLQIFIYEYPIIGKDDSKSEIKLYRKGEGELHCMWRSRDLFTAWNTNLIGLSKMIMKEIFEPNNIELVRVIDFCNSLHIYAGDWESASKIKAILKSPQIMR